MGNEWNLKSLEEIAHVIMGYSPKGETYNNDGEGTPLLNGPTEFGPHSPRATLFTTDPSRISEPGDILFCVRGSTTGRMNWSDKKYAVGRGIAAIRAKTNEEDTYFIYCCIRESMQRLLSLTSGSVFPNLSTGDINGFEIPWPEKPTRGSIVHILRTLDDKIELNRRMNRTLEKMAAALFKSWFIDFDPVRAKAEGRDPGLPVNIADLFPDSFEDSELGEIPKGWRVKPIGETVQCVGGSTPSTKNSDFWEGGKHPFVTPKDMSSLQSPVILDSERHITDAGVEKVSSRQLPVGTVILSSRAPIGYLGVTSVPVSVNQGVIAMICDDDLPNLYILHWTSTNMDLIRSRAGGTTFAEISKQNFRPIPVPTPTKPVLDAFMANTAPLHERITLNVRQNRRLDSLRDTLLPQLLSGELEAPQTIEAATEVV
ncbi:MAG: restriction endonuclease subunit S [Deltaproteobacteria bacterium]|nr:restriction endonuclease subunit S [Deltaproteobacteria bacterium]